MGDFSVFYKVIFWDLLIGLIRDGVLGFVMALLLYAVYGVLALLIFFLVDGVGVQSYTQDAVIKNTSHNPAWVQIVSTGKTTSTIYHPESWDADVAYNAGVIIFTELYEIF